MFTISVDKSNKDSWLSLLYVGGGCRAYITYEKKAAQLQQQQRQQLTLGLQWRQQQNVSDCHLLTRSDKLGRNKKKVTV